MWRLTGRPGFTETVCAQPPTEDVHILGSLAGRCTAAHVLHPISCARMRAREGTKSKRDIGPKRARPCDNLPGAWPRCAAASTHRLRAKQPPPAEACCRTAKLPRRCLRPLLPPAWWRAPTYRMRRSMPSMKEPRQGSDTISLDARHRITTCCTESIENLRLGINTLTSLGQEYDPARKSAQRRPRARVPREEFALVRGWAGATLQTRGVRP